jgi:hypothetical protein
MSISKGIPIQERTADDVREALKGQEKEVIAAFLRLHTYAQEHHLGISKLAAQTGISQTSLSQSFNGDYEEKGGNLSETSQRIETFFWKMEQKALHDAQKRFVATRISRVLWKLFEKVRHARRIQPIQSPEQVGKTVSAVKYTQENNSGRTIYFTFTRSMETMNDVIHSFAESLGIAKYAKLRLKKGEIRDKLASCDLVILDEVHLAFKLSYRECCKLLDFIRTDIFENGERGVVLLCTDDRETGRFMDGLKKMAKDYRYNIGQFLGRMMVDVVSIDPGDDITEEDVALLMSRLYKPGKTVLRDLTALAQTEQSGHLGLVDYIMGEAWNKTKAREKECTDEVVAQIINTVRETLKARKDLYE